MPVPGGRFKTEVALRRELAGDRPAEAHGQKDCTDDDVAAVESRRHEERRTVNRLKIAHAGGQRNMRGVGEGLKREMIESEREGRVTVFVGLYGRERHSEE